MGLIFGSELAELIERLIREDENFANVKTIDELINKFKELGREEFQCDIM